MAAVAEISVLLFALINNIHAEELIMVREVRGSHTFTLPKEANSSCLISRFVGEEKLVLWNTSDLWSQNSTTPKDLKLSVVTEANISSYIIHNLTHSDSGPYQEQCWTEGKVTHERNISLTVCTSKDSNFTIHVTFGKTADLPCIGAADNLDVQWLKREFKYEQETWTRVFGDNTTLVMDNVGGRYQVVKNTSALRVSIVTTTVYTSYTCLVMNQQQCVSSNTVMSQLTEIIYGSVEETTVLPCTVTDFTDDQPRRWSSYSSIDLGQLNTSVDQNYSLVFPSLTLKHTDVYICKASIREQRYWLLVCPKSGPPAVELFSEGEEVSLRCRDLEEHTMWHDWFIKVNQTEGRIVAMTEQRMGRVTLFRDGSLVISNVSREDTGEYWCAVADIDGGCVSTTRILLKNREAFGIHSVVYVVRCAVLSGLLVTLCVVVVAVNWRTRRTQRTQRTWRTQRTQRGEQRSAGTES